MNISNELWNLSVYPLTLSIASHTMLKSRETAIFFAKTEKAWSSRWLKMQSVLQWSLVLHHSSSIQDHSFTSFDNSYVGYRSNCKTADQNFWHARNPTARLRAGSFVVQTCQTTTDLAKKKKKLRLKFVQGDQLRAKGLICTVPARLKRFNQKIFLHGLS